MSTFCIALQPGQNCVSVSIFLPQLEQKLIFSLICPADVPSCDAADTSDTPDTPDTPDASKTLDIYDTLDTSGTVGTASTADAVAADGLTDIVSATGCIFVLFLSANNQLLHYLDTIQLPSLLDPILSILPLL